MTLILASDWASATLQLSGILVTLNTIAVRQLGIDFQYIQIKSFDNNLTSAPGSSESRLMFAVEEFLKIEIDVKAMVGDIQRNRPFLQTFHTLDLRHDQEK